MFLRYKLIVPFAPPACNESTNLQCMFQYHMLYAELLRPILQQENDIDQSCGLH